MVLARSIVIWLWGMHVRCEMLQRCVDVGMLCYVNLALCKVFRFWNAGMVTFVRQQLNKNRFVLHFM